MAHERKKKAGERKDKKIARMRESVAFRKGMGSTEPHHSDQGDVVNFKQGSPEDRNRDQHVTPSR